MYQSRPAAATALPMATARPRSVSNPYCAGLGAGPKPAAVRPGQQMGPGQPGKEASVTTTIRIAMWSGPRNISTAMMRAWSSRADTSVMDEPFYAAYLAESGLDHPMRSAILASQPTDWEAVARVCSSADRTPIVFQKHMCQHMLPEAPLGWMAHCRHAFLIRPPAEVAASFGRKWSGWGAEDLGFRRQAELFDNVCQIRGSAPPVILAADVQQDPAGILKALCAALGVEWDPAMLTWAPGPHADDGVWGAHWYNTVIGSTGFARPQSTAPAPAPELAGVIEQCIPHYEAVMRHRLRPA